MTPLTGAAAREFGDRADRLSLRRADHFERVAAPRRLERHAIDIIGNEDAVVAVHGVAVLGDLQEAYGLGSLGARSRCGHVFQLGGGLQNAGARRAGNLPFPFSTRDTVAGDTPASARDVADGERFLFFFHRSQHIRALVKCAHR